MKILTKLMTTCLLFADQMKRFISNSRVGDAPFSFIILTVYLLSSFLFLIPFFQSFYFFLFFLSPFFYIIESSSFFSFIIVPSSLFKLTCHLTFLIPYFLSLTCQFALVSLVACVCSYHILTYRMSTIRQLQRLCCRPLC